MVSLDKYLEFVAMVISVIGQLLMVFKNEWAFVLWIGSNFVWIYLCLKDHRYFMTTTFIIYSIIDIVSIYAWTQGWI